MRHPALSRVGTAALLAALLFPAMPLAHAEAPVAAEMEGNLKRTGQTYAERIRIATEELAATRARILREKTPLVARWQELETKQASLETQISRLKSSKEQEAERNRQLSKDADLLRRNIGYLNTVTSDSIKTLELSLRPGESVSIERQIAELQRSMEKPQMAADGSAAVDIARAGVERITQCLGGSLNPGQALIGNDTRIVEGSFALLGPESYFLSKDGTTVGTVRSREGAPLPIVHTIEGWQSASAAPLFAGNGSIGSLMADPTGGKALRLTETKGTFTEHVHKGGIVAYSILATGLVALGLIVLKLRDLLRLGVDSPKTMEPLIMLVADGKLKEARAAAHKLKPATREIVHACIDQAHLNREILEDNLEALLTRKRLEAERRLPLLAVIATASPLMGLLGTVMGMVKTFALITVFGTGNAGKLSSGISEVLVTTELGLAVAIPSLVMHGFLAHRIHKHLDLLERYAFELVLALKVPRPAVQTGVARLPGNQILEEAASVSSPRA